MTKTKTPRKTRRAGDADEFEKFRMQCLLNGQPVCDVVCLHG